MVPDEHIDETAGADSARPFRRPHVEERQAGRDLVLFDALGGRLHVLNATAAMVWRMCDGTRSASDIANGLGREFELAPGNNPAADVRALLEALMASGLVRIEIRGVTPGTSDKDCSTEGR